MKHLGQQISWVKPRSVFVMPAMVQSECSVVGNTARKDSISALLARKAAPRILMRTTMSSRMALMHDSDNECTFFKVRRRTAKFTRDARQCIFGVSPEAVEFPGAFGAMGSAASAVTDGS